MKMYKFIIISLLVVLLTVSCTQEQKNPIRNKPTQNYPVSEPDIASLIEISTLPEKDLYSIGESVEIIVNVPDSIAIDSLQLQIDGKQVVSTQKEPFSYIITTEKLKTGSHVIKLFWYIDAKRKSKSAVINFLSDIEPVNYTYRVKNIFKHDKEAYTQGLIYYNDFLYEATGLKGKSSVRKVIVETGEVIQGYTVPAEVFGEGITIIDNKIIQLSWRAQTGYVYDLESFELLGKFNYETEGWGLTHNDTHLIMSDGSSTLYFLETSSYSVVNQIEVFDNKGPVYQLNELEYIDGEIFANVYQTEYIVRIDPSTGKVLGRINFRGLLATAEMAEDVDVLNGIAYDIAKKRLFVTGKKWPKLFEVELIKE